ncbi:acyltransferase family protein [Klenkia taihuensis]|uniref:Fucose 4-O-acetylase n=1 Tax=Klenkia taihuensis TaxID=1225127 RepID=A0A1I1NQ12_9ACTN|nr:acyltransferase [Klenkia taihuensis]GHE11785.1 hypothetical protein GCM10011381_26740 [Klenkia taihuensis]SFC99617.1 Fucose 4-O-acetylase [Klenkia taihuensis]
MTAAVPTRRRVVAIDVARALAIVGVVINHSIDGLVAAGLAPPGGWLHDANAALHVFRMPTLVFLVGVFVPLSAVKRGRLASALDRVRLFGWLYLVWFILQGAIEFGTNDLRNTPRGIAESLRPWESFAHLWFLPFLVVTAVVLAVLAPWRSRSRAAGSLVLLFATAVTTWSWNSDVVGLTGLSLLFFAAAGSAIGMNRVSQLLSADPRLVAATAGVALTLFLLLSPWDLAPATRLGPTAPVPERLAAMVAAVAGMAALLAVASLLARTGPLARRLASIGRETLPIFLAHVMVVAGVRVCMVGAGVTSPLLILGVAVVLGVAIPLAARAIVRRSAFTAWVFDLPRWATRPDVRRSERAPN